MWQGDLTLWVYKDHLYSAFFLYPGVSSVVLQKQIKDLHQEQKVLRDAGVINLLLLLFLFTF